MSDSDQQLDRAIYLAKIAIECDQKHEYVTAIDYYIKSINLLRKVIADHDSEKCQVLKEKINEYNKRVEEIKQITNTTDDDNHKEIIRKFHEKLQLAMEADELGAKEDAIDSYAFAVEFISNFPNLLQGELKEITLKALERAETLKGIRKEELKSNRGAPPPLHRGSSAHLKVSGFDVYTDEEKRVLLHTSNINRHKYVPFLSIDLEEKFQYSYDFVDKDGHLQLSPKQKREFSGWKRLFELGPDPCIVDGLAPNYLNIKQTVISDCSFVASLAVSALYEQRFGKKLVTSIIYPQNPKTKQPRYNSYGKYMIKLHLNGIARKVIIDDHLPINRHGDLLCSYSSNRNEFWISLLEKAYMKVMGGYDFPGSNSNIDLHALTGWIPERTPIRINDPDFNGDALFMTLETRLAKGDVLVTVATGELSDSDAERSGLVSTHAYAVIDVRTIDNVKLVKLKNPWSHMRWKGNYSEWDLQNWTTKLQLELNYDPRTAAKHDNGVFWIDYRSLLAFFDVFYMNWNPALFKYTYCIHQSWHAGLGPMKDLYTISSNPQFSLEIDSPNVSGAVWLLLTRHITDIDDFRENKEYITMLVYKNNGKRVYYPHDPPPYIDGVKINSPHYLCKIILNPGSSRKYTVVISQYEKTQTIYYTLRAYATCDFKLNKIQDVYKYQKEITGEWKDQTAGGCPNHTYTYKNNPKIKFGLESNSNTNQLIIELKGPKQYQMGIELIITKLYDETITAPFKSKYSGIYRTGYVVLELDDLPAGIYSVIPSTYYPKQEGPFILTIKSSASIEFMK